MNNMTKYRMMRKTSAVVSMLFNPYTLPVIGMLVLFSCSFLHILPTRFKLIVWGMTCVFTVIMPLLGILLTYHFARDQKGEKKVHSRFTIFLLFAASYLCCLLLMNRLNIPSYISGLIRVPLVMIILFFVGGIKLNLSLYVGGAGAWIGSFIIFSAIFGYNPVWWLCVFILVTGLLATARIILARHTLIDVLLSFAIGLMCAILALSRM